MREEFNKLEELLSSDTPLDVQQLDHILAESIVLFSKLKDVLQTGSNDEKSYMLKLMNLLNEKIRQRFQYMLDKAGDPQEQFLETIRNPKNFSPEKWKARQGIKEKMAEKQKTLAKSLARAQSVVDDPNIKKAMQGAAPERPKPSKAKRLGRKNRRLSP